VLKSTCPKWHDRITRSKDILQRVLDYKFMQKLGGIEAKVTGYFNTIVE
jgi:hypothetical protein